MNSSSSSNVKRDHEFNLHIPVLHIRLSKLVAIHISPFATEEWNVFVPCICSLFRIWGCPFWPSEPPSIEALTPVEFFPDLLGH